MKVKILKNTVAAGVNVKEGQIVDIPVEDARTLFLFGKAERCEAKTGGSSDGDNKRLNAKDTIAAVKAIETLEELDAIAEGEDRKSVVETIEAKRAELEETA